MCGLVTVHCPSCGALSDTIELPLTCLQADGDDGCQAPLSGDVETELNSVEVAEQQHDAAPPFTRGQIRDFRIFLKQLRELFSRFEAFLHSWAYDDVQKRERQSAKALLELGWRVLSQDLEEVVRTFRPTMVFEEGGTWCTQSMEETLLLRMDGDEEKICEYRDEVGELARWILEHACSPGLEDCDDEEEGVEEEEEEEGVSGDDGYSDEDEDEVEVERFVLDDEYYRDYEEVLVFSDDDDDDDGEHHYDCRGWEGEFDDEDARVHAVEPKSFI